MSKFKVGDKIIAKKNAPYAITTNGWTGVVTKVKENGLFDGSNFHNLNEKYFYPVPESKIVITTDGVKTVTAKLYEGKKVIKTAEAKCSPKDKFDFGYGTALAVERLTGHVYDKLENTIEEEKYFTGKVRCVKCRNDFLTEGKTYEFTNGYSVDDVGNRFPYLTRVKSLRQLNTTMFSDFEEVTDDESPKMKPNPRPEIHDALEVLEKLTELAMALEKFQ